MALSEPEQQLVGTIVQSRYIGAAVVLATLWTLESVVPMYRNRKRRLAHGASNLGLALINAAVGFAAAFALLAATEHSRLNSWGLLHQFTLPAWTQWVLAIVLIDCWQYWWHRINHRVPLFWRFHAVHHSDAAMDATSAVRFHTGEIVFSFAARLLLLPLIGVTIPQLVLYEAISLPIILFHHSNVRVPSGLDRCLRWLIVTPWMHWVHHSRWQPETDSNYSSFLSIWDRLFGSFRLRDDPSTISLGLDGDHHRGWHRLPGMLAAPFRRWTASDTESHGPSESSDQEPSDTNE